MTLTRKQVLDVLDYHPETGTFTWKVAGYKRKVGGDARGTNGKSWIIRIAGTVYTCASLVWLVETGKWPKRQLYKIDGDSRNDRFSNLLETVSLDLIKTPKQLFSYFNYHADTGTFTWKAPTASGNRIGDTAGSMAGSAWQIRIACKHYTRARLVWFAETGKWPKHQIDHKNGDTSDDRFCNLRDLTVSQARQNQPIRQRGKFMMGVRRSRSGKFYARISAGRRSISSKFFDTELEAHIEWLHMKEKHHPFQTERVNSNDDA